MRYLAGQYRYWRRHRMMSRRTCVLYAWQDWRRRS